jgi:hypothetical protein
MTDRSEYLVGEYVRYVQYKHILDTEMYLVATLLIVLLSIWFTV